MIEFQHNVFRAEHLSEVTGIAIKILNEPKKEVMWWEPTQLIHIEIIRSELRTVCFGCT